MFRPCGHFPEGKGRGWIWKCKSNKNLIETQLRDKLNHRSFLNRATGMPIRSRYLATVLLDMS